MLNYQTRNEPQQIGLNIGGLVPFSTIDYPGYLAAVLFCQGCLFRCRYCHNPELARPVLTNQELTGQKLTGQELTHPKLKMESNYLTKFQWQDICDFLGKRKNILEAVVFSGGEPTLQAGLRNAICETKRMGFKVALHTAGPLPLVLAKILPMLDWIGMDIKAPLGQYEQVTRVRGNRQNFLDSSNNSNSIMNNIMKSIKLILASNTPYEFRTTIHPDVLSEEQIVKIADELQQPGVTNYKLQRFRSQGCLDEGLNAAQVINFPSVDVIEKLSEMFDKFVIV